jgi:hypothetical protein
MLQNEYFWKLNNPLTGIITSEFDLITDEFIRKYGAVTSVNLWILSFKMEYCD